MCYFGLQNRVYEKPVCLEIASDTSELTFIHISFAKKFCQNKVKKNCKFISQFFFNNTYISLKKKLNQCVCNFSDYLSVAAMAFFTVRAPCYYSSTLSGSFPSLHSMSITKPKQAEFLLPH